jgi:hypothetical protein
MTTTTAKPGRNEPCHCGSGKKYKQCHLQQDEAEARTARLAAAAVEAAAEPAAPEGETPPAPAAQPVHTAPRKQPTHQPWKKANTHGFQRMSTPRKVGGGG